MLMVVSLITGASYPLRAMRIFWRSPGLLRFLILPILINFFVGISLYFGLLFPLWRQLQGLLRQGEGRINSLLINLPPWLHLLDNLFIVFGYIFSVLIALGLLILTGFLLLQFGTILGAPWYGKLSEQMEKFRLGTVEVVEVGFIRDIGRALLFEVKKLCLWFGVAIPLMVLNFLPGVGTLAVTIGWISLTMVIICLDFLDGPSERRRFPFRKKLAIAFRALPASAGFSLVCLGLISIPFLNLVTIPVCVASGTLFWCDRVYRPS